MTVFTVDVSHHDWDRSKGEIDWTAVARSGIAAACVRATYGDPNGFSPTTRHAGEMIRGARAAGLITGAYHNLVRGDAASVRRQVDWLRSEMDRHGATWAMLDVERYEELLARDLEPRIGDVREFCARWKTVDSRPLLVYLPRWVWSGHLGSPDLRGLGCPLVASDYGTNGSGAPAALYAARNGDAGRGWQPYGGVTPVLWQFGSRAQVPGLGPPTDINAFRGTVAQLRTLLDRKDSDMPTVDEFWESDRIQRYDAEGAPVPESDPNPKMTADFALGWAVREATLTRIASSQLLQEVTVLRGVIQDLITVIQAGGGTVDTAAILAGVDQRLAAVRADLRDAVADLGEGGAAQVRAAP